MHFESRTMIYVLVKNGPSEEPVVRKQFTFVSRLKKIVKYLMHEDYRVVRFPDLCLLRRRKASSRHCGRARRLHRLLHLQSASLRALQLGPNDEALLQKICSSPHSRSWGKHCTCQNFLDFYIFIDLFGKGQCFHRIVSQPSSPTIKNCVR